MHSLPLFIRLRDRPVILLGEGPMAEAKARLLARAGARIVGEDDAAQIAVIALADAGDNEAAAARLRARGVLINVVDTPALSDFTFPAIVDRDPVIVAIGTGGTSAGLSATLRQRLEAMLPSRLGALARALFDGRDVLRARFPAMDDRRRAIAGLLAPGGPLDPLVGHDDPAAAIAAAAEALPSIERVEIRSGDPDELTVRAARLLGMADRLYHDDRIPPAILDRARADATRIPGAAPDDAGPGLSVELVWAAA